MIYRKINKDEKEKYFMDKRPSADADRMQQR